MSSKNLEPHFKLKLDLSASLATVLVVSFKIIMIKTKIGINTTEKVKESKLLENGPFQIGDHGSN